MPDLGFRQKPSSEVLGSIFDTGRSDLKYSYMRDPRLYMRDPRRSISLSRDRPRLPEIFLGHGRTALGRDRERNTHDR